jgi:hypothetical protein
MSPDGLRHAMRNTGGGGNANDYFKKTQNQGIGMPIVRRIDCVREPVECILFQPNRRFGA